MTLIAHFTYPNTSIPFFMGDSLLSQNYKPENGIVLPSHGKVGFPKTSEGLYIGGLEQKVNIINDNLLVCWAGNRKIAHCICNEIYSNFHKKFTLDAIFNFLNEKENYINNKCTFFVSGIIEGKCFTVEQNSIKMGSYKNLSSCYVQGTGYPDFLDYVSEHSAFKSIDGDDNSTIIQNNRNAIYDAICNLSRFYFGDLFEYKSAEASFGGIHEVATIMGGKFKKIDDILIAFIKHDCTVDSDYDSNLLRTFLKYDVIGNYSIIRTILTTQNQNGDISVEQFGSVIPPIIDELKKQDEKLINDIISERKFFYSELLPDFRSKFDCIFLILEDGINRICIPMIHSNLDRKTWLDISLVDGKTEYLIKDELLEKVKHNIDRFVDRKNKKLIL